MSAPFVRRWLELPGRGVGIRLLDWGGTGPLALLSHANGFCAATWAPVAEQLRAGYRVVAFDARGHGDSSKPPGPAAYGWSHLAEDLVVLAEQLTRELSQPSVALAAGHSLGGTCTLEAAARRPDLFDRIALLDPVVLPPPHLAAELRPGSRDLGRSARRRRQVWDSRTQARRVWLTRELFRDWDPRALDLYLQEGLRDRDDGRVELQCPPEVEAAIFQTEDRLDPFAAAAKLEAPALLVRARRGYFSRLLYESLVEKAASMRLVEIDAGHLLPMTVPDRIGEMLRRFGEGPTRAGASVSGAP